MDNEPTADLELEAIERGIEGAVPDFLVLTESGELAFYTDVPGPSIEILDTRDPTAPKPDYPSAAGFIPAKYFRARRDGKINKIVIHITDGQPDHRRTARYFSDPSNDGKPVYASAHYVVGQKGEVLQMVQHKYAAYHASSANDTSIGIEHSARTPKEWGPKDPGLMPTPEQYRGSARLVRWLCDQYGIPMDRQHIQGHCEADPTTSHTDCPNGVWDWDGYMKLVREG